MRMVAQVNLEALIAEDLLLLAEDRVCEVGSERGDRLDAIVGRPHEADGGCFGSILRPCWSSSQHRLARLMGLLETYTLRRPW